VFLRGRWRSQGKGALQRPAKGELAGIDLEVKEEKGTSTVLVEVKAAPEVDRSDSVMQGPRWQVDDVDRWLRGRYGYRLGQEAVGRTVGGRGVLHPERKVWRGREKRKGGTTAIG
jgi:hypothetical protein